MRPKSIRVLVVDDSRLMRTMIGDCVTGTDDLTLAGTAAAGREAVELVSKLRPDVVTMDVEMPGMNGLEALSEIMRLSPVPVIIVSSQTTRAARVTLEALDRGAIDYVAKPEGARQVQHVLDRELVPKIRMAAAVDLAALKRGRRSELRRPAQDPMPATLGVNSAKCIAIGISTGGPPALAQLFEQLAPPLPPIVIVQHMPAKFTGPFAGRLDGLSALSVKEAATGDALEANHVLIAPGGKHLTLRSSAGKTTAVIRDGDPVSGHKPSADVMMASAASIFGRRCLGVIMTGMGSDGADGCRDIKQRGGFVIGQDGESSAVYGMNKVAFERGSVDCQFSLMEAANIITRYARELPRMAQNRGAVRSDDHSALTTAHR